MKSSFLLRAGLLMLVAFAAPRWAAAHDYNYIEGGFAHLQNDLADDGGFRAEASIDLAPPFAAFGDYSDTGDFRRFSVGGLYHLPLDGTLDFDAGVSFDHESIHHYDDSGIGVRAGVWWWASRDFLQLRPEVRYSSLNGIDGMSARSGADPRGAQSGCAGGGAGRRGRPRRGRAALQFRRRALWAPLNAIHLAFSDAPRIMR